MFASANSAGDLTGYAAFVDGAPAGTLAAAVFMLGFLAKDFVISWRPLGVRRDPDHHSIIFTWWA